MGGKSGGTTTQIIQPTPPPAPSTAESIQAWVNAMPQVFQAQLDYAPKEAAQQVQLAQQYAQPMAAAYKTAQETLYPETSALQESLAGQAQAGMQSDVPDWMRQEYQSNMNAILGTNVNAPIGADYVSRGLLQQKQDYQNYYRNLALSLADRQPLSQPQTPNYTNHMGQFGPQAGLNYSANTYGTYAGLTRPIVTQNQQGTPNWIPMLSAGGQAAGGAAALMMMCWVAAELYGGWDHPKTNTVRNYLMARGWKWFVALYRQKGREVARFIHNKPILKAVIRPLFDHFYRKGVQHGF